MIRLIEFLIAIALVVVIFLVVGALLPSKRHVRNTTETSRPMPVVVDFVSGFKRFKDWAPFKANFVTSGPDIGVGAQVDYNSTDPMVGSGTWKVKEIIPGERVVMSVDNKDLGHDKTVVFKFKRVGNQKLTVEITEEYSVDYGWNLFGHYAGLYVTRSIGDPMKRGLQNLSTQLASIPKFDYTELPVAPKIVKIPAENLLYASTKAKRANEDIQLAMTNEEKWLHQVMDKNDLEPAGPLRIVSTELGQNDYSFDVAIPVKKKGTTQAPDAPLPALDVKIDPTGGNPVKFVQTAPGSAIMTTYQGHMAQLAGNREKMKAWAAVRAIPLGERPYETYNKGIADSFTSDGDFVTYWPLKAADAK